MEFIDLKAQYAVLQPEIDAAVRRVFDHGQYILGPEVRELETRLATYTGARHCVTVASGTEALLIALMAIGIRPGDEVVTSPFTFVATAEMILLLGATPVLVDVESDTANMDVSKLEAAITPRTRAIMPVSLYGQTCDMDAINAIAAARGFAVIEDAAQSFGASYRSRKSCNLSTIGCTSFFPSKPLGCYGDGGAIFTSDDAIAAACREIRVHGQERRYYHTRIGVGGRMDTMQCAIVLAKLARFDWELGRRREIGASYTELFAALAPRVRTLRIRSDRDSVYAQYTVRVSDREGVQARLSKLGIPTAVHYPISLHRQPAYAARCVGSDFPAADGLAGSVLSLPMHPYLEAQTQEQIVDALKQATA